MKTMQRLIKPKSKVLLFLSVLLCASVTVILAFSLLSGTASAQEQKEQRIKNAVEGEFEGIAKAKLNGGSEGRQGKLEHYYLESSSGEELGRVTVVESTEEIASIVHLQKEICYGEPKLTVEDLRATALEYLSGWGYEMGKDYYQESEEIRSCINSGPTTEETSYEYAAIWRRVAGDTAVLDDSCSIRINPYSGEIISCNFPTNKKVEAEEIANSVKTISQKEAIDAAQKGCPSSEEWMKGILGDNAASQDLDLKVSIDAQKLIQTNKDNPVIWRVMITYELYPKGAEQIIENINDHEEYLIDVDAETGAIIIVL